ncbi:UNVERIFIED_CONTAM: hypothetical protein FKN15_013014 [Acipenser sinensis]
MSDKSELKAELERKKQRLAQIREEKKRKEEERKKKEADQKKEAAPPQDDSDLEKKRREADALLQSMGITPDAPVVPPPMSPSSKSVSTPSEAGSQDSGDGAIGARRGPLKLRMGKITHVDFPPREVVSYTKETQTPVVTQQKEDGSRKNTLKLGMAKMTHVDFPPREVVSYTKETQTPVVTQQKEEEDEEEETAPLKPVIEPEEEKAVQKEEEEAPHELTEEEKLQVLHSEEFLSFFDHSTRIVERALSEHVDVFFDYSGRDLEEKEGYLSCSDKTKYLANGGKYCNVKSTMRWLILLLFVQKALFACVDGVGRLDLWNLNNDTEVPTASITVEGNPALNRVRWAHSGREIAVGDSDGQILIYDVGEVSEEFIHF